ADVAEVDLPDLRRAEIADHLLGVLAGDLLAPLEPGAAAEADADVRAVRNLEGPLVPVEAAEDTPGDAGEDGDRRVLRMESRPHADLLGHRDDLLDEEGVVVPDFFLGELAAVRERLGPGLVDPPALLLGARQVEHPGRGPADKCAAAAPDAVAHVGICRVGD